MGWLYLATPLDADDGIGAVRAGIRHPADEVIESAATGRRNDVRIRTAAEQLRNVYVGEIGDTAN